MDKDEAFAAAFLPMEFLDAEVLEVEQLEEPPEPDPPAGDGGWQGRRHGIGPATVVMALAAAGFRGPIEARCLQQLVELAAERGLRRMVSEVYEDTGLTVIASGGAFPGAWSLLRVEEARQQRKSCAGMWLAAEPIKAALEDVNLSAFSRYLAARFGTNQASEIRQLQRIRNGDVARLQEATADKVAVGLRRHLLDFYPSWR
jgi:hypothetical protein